MIMMIMSVGSEGVGQEKLTIESSGLNSQLDWPLWRCSAADYSNLPVAVDDGP